MRVGAKLCCHSATPCVWHKEWNIFAERVTGRFTGWNDAVFMPAFAGAAAIELAGGTDPFGAQLADVASAIRDHRDSYIA